MKYIVWSTRKVDDTFLLCNAWSTDGDAAFIPAPKNNCSAIGPYWTMPGQLENSTSCSVKDVSCW